jgi:hypothetical protein
VKDKLHAVALSQDEVERILAVCGTRALLVGGQSLAFWALHYGVRPVGVLSQSVTTDVDFIGTAAVAALLKARLGEPWQLCEATLDDGGAQTAKVYEVLPDNGLKQIDFSSGIVGVDTHRAHERAVEIETPGGWIFRVLHPLDVLESRLQNLATLPDKRDRFGVAQADLAVQVVRAFIERCLADGGAPRVVFQAIKRVTKLALDSRLAETAFRHGVDVLSAVPVERIEAPAFRQRRWPDVLARLERKRRRYQSRQEKPPGQRSSARRSSGRESS